MTDPKTLTELAERLEREGERIARVAQGYQGVNRAAIQTAADCFTVAAALKARAQGEGD